MGKRFFSHSAFDYRKLYYTRTAVKSASDFDFALSTHAFISTFVASK